jgi:hypothetical protein
MSPFGAMRRDGIILLVQTAGHLHGRWDAVYRHPPVEFVLEGAVRYVAQANAEIAPARS